MNSQQKLINILSICRKADKLILGFDAVKEETLAENVSCVIVTEDISEKTLKEVNFFCKNCSVDIVELEVDSYDMFDAVGKKAVVAGVRDYGLAEKVKALGKVKSLKIASGKSTSSEQDKDNENENSQAPKPKANNEPAEVSKITGRTKRKSRADMNKKPGVK